MSCVCHIDNFAQSASTNIGKHATNQQKSEFIDYLKNKKKLPRHISKKKLQGPKLKRVLFTATKNTF